MKTAPRTLGRYFTHRGLTSIRGNVLDFKLPIYQGFSGPVFGHFPASVLELMLVRPFVSATFLQFRNLLGRCF
jgi:hypothetical protein